MLVLQLARSSTGLVAALMLAQGVAFSFDGQPQSLPTHAAFYVGAAFAGLLTAVLPWRLHTKRRKASRAGAADQEGVPASQAPVAAGRDAVGGNVTVYGNLNMGARGDEPSAKTPAESRRPHVRFLPPSVSKATVHAPHKLATSGTFFVVRVANDPPPGVMGVAAKHVVANLTITVPDGTVLFRDVAARWQDKPQAAQLSPYHPMGAPELREAELPPNGAPSGIDTFVYLPRDREFHLWTQAGLAGRIKATEFIVAVRVRGTNVDTSASYRIAATPEDPVDGFTYDAVASPTSTGSRPPSGSHDPWEGARALQMSFEAKQIRNAMRCVAEDELANLNRPRLLKLLEGDETGINLATAQWSQHADLIRGMPEPEPYKAAAAAYRSLRDLGDKLGIEGRRRRLGRADYPLVRRTLTDVEHAIEVFRKHQP